MTTIDKDTAYYLSKLCALKIDENEAEKYSKQLNSIIEYAQQLNELDTSKIDPSFHGNLKSTVMREDEVEIFANSDNILDNAIEKSGTSFSVPNIL